MGGVSLEGHRGPGAPRNLKPVLRQSVERCPVSEPTAVMMASTVSVGLDARQRYTASVLRAVRELAGRITGRPAGVPSTVATYSGRLALDSVETT